MKRRVVVTGLGVVTSLGRAIDSFWDRLVNGASGVGPITLFDVTGFRVHPGGMQAIWTRSRAGYAVDAGWLAIISDFFLGAHPGSRGPGSSSLDAMLRFVQGCEPGWVLSVTEFSAFSRGVVHGSARHFAEDGRLLAISSQSGVLPRIPMGEF